MKSAFQYVSFSHQIPAAFPISALSKLVVLESTTYPGTTEDELRAVLNAGSGLTTGKDFHLAFLPEREDPGTRNAMKGIPVKPDRIWKA